MRKVSTTEWESRLLDQSRDNAVRRIHQNYDNTMSELTAQYPALEREGWAKQETEARIVADGGTSALVSKMAQIRGITASEMATRIIVKADVFADLYAEVTANLHNLGDAIDAAYADGDIPTLDMIG